MKAFVLATCLLIMIVYAADAQLVERLPEALTKCPSVVTQCAPNPSTLLTCYDTWYCLLKVLGVVDENDVLMDKRALEFCEFLITDPKETAHCEKVASQCFEKGNQISGSDSEKTRVKLTCTVNSGLPSLVLSIPNLTNIPGLIDAVGNLNLPNRIEEIL
ncbi:venom allergen 2-like [Monomorium pharaonis]|uniref:venom allergen 2-like n=1 Tax=Monomorium pharaonis TaxID=307658 RepID=UPI001746F9E1|nr:venom allergen 2-like [Monomorium pharaonis]